MNKWPRRAIYVSVAAFWCLIFLSIGGFSLRQSAVLGPSMAFVVFVIVFIHEQTRPRNRFIPYYVRVVPNWYQILEDFKLVSTPEEWKSIRESVKQLSLAQHHVFRDGLFFAVLQASQDLRHCLIFWSRANTFSGKVDFQWDMNPVQVGREDEDSKELIQQGLLSSSQEIHFFMKPGKEGYDLGLSVPDSWWRRLKGSCPSPEEEEIDQATGYVKLVLARISQREWDLYWEPEVWDSKYFFKTVPQIKTRREEFRQKFGWKTVMHPDIPELKIRWPEEMEHKYLRMEHRAI
jgi:hypothetical protein